MPPEVAQRIRAEIYRDTRPVKPLMPGFAYALLVLAVFAGLSALYAFVLGFEGVHALSASAVLALLLTLVICAILASVNVARSMRPAAGSLHTWFLTLLAFGAYEALIWRLFHDYSTSGFISNGVLCLALGALGGTLVAFPLWLIVRRGFVVQPVLSGAAIGLVAGLSGLTALTLHCPILTVPHTAVWHAAVVVVCVAAGALASHWLPNRWLSHQSQPHKTKL